MLVFFGSVDLGVVVDLGAVRPGAVLGVAAGLGLVTEPDAVGLLEIGVRGVPGIVAC